MKQDLGPARARFPDYRFSQRVRRNRVYITIIPGEDIHPDYTNLSCILRHVFPGIRVTSGSAYGVTGVMPTLLELIESPPKQSWAAIMREKLSDFRVPQSILDSYEASITKITEKDPTKQ